MTAIQKDKLNTVQYNVVITIIGAIPSWRDRKEEAKIKADAKIIVYVYKLKLPTYLFQFIPPFKMFCMTKSSQNETFLDFRTKKI